MIIIYDIYFYDADIISGRVGLDIRQFFSGYHRINLNLIRLTWSLVGSLGVYTHMYKLDTKKRELSSIDPVNFYR